MTESRRIAVAAERSSEYGRRFIQGVASVAERHPEWDLVLLDPDRVADAVSDGYDGWICRVADVRTKNALMKCGKPVVDCLCAQECPSFAALMTDADAIGRLAAEHLMKRRFSNYAFCGYRDVAFSDRRRNAFAAFLEENGIRPSIYRPQFSRRKMFGRDFLLGDRVAAPPDADELAKWLMRLPKPVGVFCCDDLRASQLVSLCHSLKLAVPGDVAVLGVDNDPIYCMFSMPRISSIDPDALEIGRTAADTLAKILEDKRLAKHPPRIAVPPKGVAARESTNSYPNAPHWFTDAFSFIRENASKGISASDVFRHVGYSRTLVERAFRESAKSSVQREIVAARIEETKRLLASTSRPIKEVARLSGFSSIEYLSRTFAAATGLSPTAWRKQNLKDA